jgi:hypothetical protein
VTIELSFAAFDKLRGKTFLVSRDGVPPVELELIELEDLRGRQGKLPDHVRQAPFRMTFRGPLEPLLPQSMYTLETEDSDCVTLFLVPLERGKAHMLYHVVVN